MKSIIPNIAVENCKEALDFYKVTFGGEIKMVKVADNGGMFKGHEGKIMHSELHMDKNCIIYFTDLFGEKSPNSNVQLILEMDSLEQLEKIYAGIAEGGKITYELQKTFWGAYHAVVTDRYGVTWGLNYSEGPQ